MTYSFDVTTHDTTISVEMDPSTGSVTLEGERFNARHDPEHARIACERAIEAIANLFIGKRDEIRQEGYDEGYAAGLEDAEAEIKQDLLDRECRNAFDKGQERMKAMLQIEHAQSIKPHTDKAYRDGIQAGKDAVDSENKKEHGRTWTEGYEAGIKQGHETGWRDGQATLKRELEDQHQEDLNREHDAARKVGSWEGHAKGFNEGYRRGQNVQAAQTRKVQKKAAKDCQRSHAEGFKEGRADADANRAACIEDARRKAYAEGVKAGKTEAGTEAYFRGRKMGKEMERARLRTELGL